MRCILNYKNQIQILQSAHHDASSPTLSLSTMIFCDDNIPYTESTKPVDYGNEFTISGKYAAFLNEETDSTNTKCLIIHIYEFAKKAFYPNSEQVMKGAHLKLDPTTVVSIDYMKSPWGRESSQCYLSLSLDGNYLAVSWLTNPQVVSASALSYCSVYDVRMSAKKKEPEFKFSPTAAIRIFQFQGACAFNPHNRLALFNKNMMNIYTIKTRRRKVELELLYSVDFRIQSGNVDLSTRDYNSKSYSLFTSESGEQDSVSSSTDQLSTMRIEDEEEQDTFDDIFYDSEGYDDFEEEEEDDDEKTLNGDARVVLSEIHHCEAKEKSGAFRQNQDFIRRNINLLKESNVVSVFGADNMMLLWCLADKKIVFAKKCLLDAGPSQLITAISKEKHLVAIASRSAHARGDPVVKLLDALSGTAVGCLSLPRKRAIEGVLQVLFLLDLYILVVTYNNNGFFFDLFDVAHNTHLDSYSMPFGANTNIFRSQFMPCDRMVPLREGGGLFFEVQNKDTLFNKNKPSKSAVDDGVNYVGGKVEVKRMKFFEKAFRLTNTRRKRWYLAKSDNIQGAHALYPVSGEPPSKQDYQHAYFLDRAETYLMSIYEPETCSSYVIHSIWKVQPIRISNEKSTTHRVISLKSIVLTYPYISSKAISNPYPSINYHSMLYNLRHLENVERINPVIITPDNTDNTSLLVIKINDMYDSVDYGTISGTAALLWHLNTEKNIIIPLHRHGLVESYLNAIATQTESEFSFPQIQQHVAQVVSFPAKRHNPYKS